jgi:hypothetical protein
MKTKTLLALIIASLIAIVGVSAQGQPSSGGTAQDTWPLTLIFWVSVGAAVVDWRYVKKGGVRSTRREKVYGALAVGLCLLLLVAVGLSGVSAAVVGEVSFLPTVLILGIWEFHRFRVRRAHPLQQTSDKHLSTD